MYQAYAYNGLASIEMAYGNYDKVLQLLLLAEKLADCGIDTGFCSGLYGTFCSCYLAKGDYERGESYCKQAYDLAVKSGVMENKRDAILHMKEYYKATGNADSAFVYSEMLAAVRDSLWNQEKDQVILDMMARYESEKKERQLEIQQMRLEASERRNLIFGLFAVIAAILLVAAFILIRIKHTTQQALEVKNAIIKKQLEEKDILLREIHHRVKNNLQIISSLLNIQRNEISDPIALEALSAARNRVKSMALIHENIYAQTNLRNVNQKKYIEQLCDHIYKSYNIETKDIELSLNVDNIGLDVETTIGIGLILNELISNSLKHAFKNQNTGLIHISLKQNHELLCIVVSDNGSGIDPLLAKQKEGSLGMKLIEAFAKKLKAEWKIVNSNGTKFTLDITNY